MTIERARLMSTYALGKGPPALSTAAFCTARCNHPIRHQPFKCCISFSRRCSAIPRERLQKRYINPLLQCRGVDVLKWSPTNPDDMPFIDLLKSSFNHDLQRPQNEMALRNSLSELWIQIYAKAEPLFSSDNASWMTNRDVQFKAILDYIRANYAAAIDVPQMASAAGVSERECYRIIEACAGTTPAAYLRAYRVNRACELLAHTTRTVQTVARQCGFATASHLGQVFKEQMGCTPSSYRAARQNLDSTRQKSR